MDTIVNNDLLEQPPARAAWLTYYKTAWFMAIVGLFCCLIFPYVGYHSLGLVYVLSILTIAALTTRGPIIFSAVIAALSWDYFFIPPRFALSLASNEDFIMLVIFFVTATVSGILTAKIKRQEENLKLKQRQMSLLYEQYKRLALANSLAEIDNIFKSTKNEVFGAGKNESQMSNEEKLFLGTLTSQITLATERFSFLQKANEAMLLQESEKLHQTLLNSVSHELRTPLTTIIGTATALKDANIIKNDEARHSLTAELIKSSQRLDRVVENLLDISRLEKDRLKIKSEWFEVSDLLTEVQKNLHEIIQGRVILVSGDLNSLIEGDFKLLEHALRNVLLNAVKYTPDQAQIEMSARVEGQTIKIQVRDDGPGVPPELAEKIFEKFYRLPGTAAGGLGLGLSIVKNILELHGGKIFVSNSVRDGKPGGAVFEMQLPYRASPEILKGIVNAGNS